MHIDRRHSFEIDLPAREAILLFTPKGEALWVEGWAPDYLYPADGEICAGMVFTTAHDEAATVWTCSHWAPAAGRVGYSRVTPGSRVAVVEIGVVAVGEASSCVSVSYGFTALAADGDTYLAHMSEAAFGRMIEGWKTSIDQWLQRPDSA
jgi:hypothetical protein